MLSPNEINNLPLDLAESLHDIKKVDALALLQPLPGEHVPLIRKEWTPRTKGLAIACGFAAVNALVSIAPNVFLGMAQGEARTILDELAGHDKAAIIQVETGHTAGDPLQTPIQEGDKKSTHDEKQPGASNTEVGRLTEEMMENGKEWADFAKDLEDEPTPLKPGNFPTYKLPFPITETTDPKNLFSRQENS